MTEGFQALIGGWQLRSTTAMVIAPSPRRHRTSVTGMRSSNAGIKRARTNDSSEYLPSLASADTVPDTTSPSSSATGSASLTFRNVSACNRCRLRKNRCDQNLPACSPCDKAGLKCVGFDPITKREIPRTYVYYLESRLTYLERLLTDNGIHFASSQEFDVGAKAWPESSQGQPPSNQVASHNSSAIEQNRLSLDSSVHPREVYERERNEQGKLNDLVSDIGMVSVRGASDPRYLGTTSADAGGTSVRDSFFGLHSRPTIEPAPFPNKDIGLRLVTLYREHANPQIPILHEGELMTLFERAYASPSSQRSARELYMLNIVFAIGAGIILEDSHLRHSSSADSREAASPPSATQQHQPEEYHASAMMHLESFLGSASAVDHSNGFAGGLEELQAVLLLAGFALLRPVTPGLWYITGVATRLAVDLGLHYEDGAGLDESGVLGSQRGQVASDSRLGNPADLPSQSIDSTERGRREWVRDLRRRLWWCVYSLDRLVSTCVGRPAGISDEVITTQFPSILNDEHITPSGFTIPSETFDGPSPKRVSHHYFRLRLLQSEILQVLQHQQAQQVRQNRYSNVNGYPHSQRSSSFLQPFASFEAWRQDVDRRLWEWKESAPLQQHTSVKFPVQFLELNYWQAIIMLYRQGLSVPTSQTNQHSAPSVSLDAHTMSMDVAAKDEDIYLKLAEAGQRTLDDVDFTILAATSVLGDLIDKCPPAESCRDAFERMSRATVKMCLSTTGFGAQSAEIASEQRHENGKDGLTVDDRWSWSQRRESLQDTKDVQPGNDSSDQAHTFSGPSIPPQSKISNFPLDLGVPAHGRSSSDQTNSTLHPVGGPLNGSKATYDLYESPSLTELDLFLAENDSIMYDSELGMNLGFGNEHDWSDGVQMDLFDGFFFGGAGNNAGSFVS
ncbi:MAG: hypothetical protein Q9220_004290 [cf. Caloplaca sp. 1 TL-2023]